MNSKRVFVPLFFASIFLCSTNLVFGHGFQYQNINRDVSIGLNSHNNQKSNRAIFNKQNVENHSHAKLIVQSNEEFVVDETTYLSYLEINSGATLSAPEGYSLTLTVDGIQRNIEEGRYVGDVVLTVSEDNIVEYENGGGQTHYFHQGLYVDETGVVKDKSVFDSIHGGIIQDDFMKNSSIVSNGDNFNGVYVSGGEYYISNLEIDFDGDGGNDFAGYGAAVMSTGEDTTVILDHSYIDTKGVVRSALIAGDGSNMIVKNSYLQSHEGVLPDDYIYNSSLGYMKTVPWSLGLTGNCRATNAVGTDTKATYINSYIGSELWGALSVDDCSGVKLTGINSIISNIGTKIDGDFIRSGYGAYAIGDAVDRFYGCEFDVADYALIMTGGEAIFGASKRTVIDELNSSDDLNLGLGYEEIASLPEQQSIIKSGRFGVMFHGDSGPVTIEDGTIFDCNEAVFLVRGASAEMNVDGKDGAQLISHNQIITQLMDYDKATFYNSTIDDEDSPYYGVTLRCTDAEYTEKYDSYDDYLENGKDDEHDILTYDESDVIGNYSNIELNGSFYNSDTGGLTTQYGQTVSSSKNLVINLVNSSIYGVISSSFAKHPVSSFGMDEYYYIGEVTNTVYPAVNNGVIVNLDKDSIWTITGDSYINVLSLEDGAIVKPKNGMSMTMYVDSDLDGEYDIETNHIDPGEYTGQIYIDVE